MKVLFYLVFLLIFFSSNSYSKNYKFIKIIELDEPWGSSFINDNEIIITEKSGKIKVVNIVSKEVTEIKHNLNFLEVKHNLNFLNVGQGGLLDILYKDNSIWVSYSEDRGNSKTSTDRKSVV